MEENIKKILSLTEYILNNIKDVDGVRAASYAIEQSAKALNIKTKGNQVGDGDWQTGDPLSVLAAYWNSALSTPRLIEKEFIEELLQKHGFKKAKKIIRSLAEKGFKRVPTMRGALDEYGNIKPKENDGKGKITAASADELARMVANRAARQS